MTKRFNDYTDAELLTLDNDTINDAIRIEAIQQGIKPPVTLSEALRKSEWRGYTKPAESVEVFELVTKNEYGHDQATGVGYLDKAQAEAALLGLLYIKNDTYSADNGYKIHNSGACIASRFVGATKAEQTWAKLQEYVDEGKEAFDKVMEACVNRLGAARQDDYNRRVRIERRAEYLRLASNNEETAKAFWTKVERTEWPDENGMPLPAND